MERGATEKSEKLPALAGTLSSAFAFRSEGGSPRSSLLFCLGQFFGRLTTTPPFITSRDAAAARRCRGSGSPSTATEIGEQPLFDLPDPVLHVQHARAGRGGALERRRAASCRSSTINSSSRALSPWLNTPTSLPLQDGHAGRERRLEAGALASDARRLRSPALSSSRRTARSRPRRPASGTARRALGHQPEHLGRPVVAVLDGLDAGHHRAAHALRRARVGHDRTAAAARGLDDQLAARLGERRRRLAAAPQR